MSKENKNFYDFDSFRLDVAERTLLQDGKPLQLTPKAFDTLLILVQNSGKVLEKDSMMQQIWQDAFVEEANLANNISVIRKTLGDDGSRFIQTVPRRGYRFIGDVKEVYAAFDDALILEKHTRSSLTIEEEKTNDENETASITQTEVISKARRVFWLSLISLALLIGIGSGLLIGLKVWKRAPPVFQQLTFRRGVTYGARFASDEKTIIYSAALEGNKYELFITRPESRESRPLNVKDAMLLSISSQGEMALLLHSANPFAPRGTLARLPITGGSPREVLEDVQDADWSPDGKELAIIRWENGAAKLEYPIKKVLYEAKNPTWIGGVRVSPKGDMIAFLNYSSERFDDRGSVVVVDLEGKKLLQSEIFTSVCGIEWSPDGKEVWFTAAESNLNNSLYAINLSGKKRLLSRIAGRMVLWDVATDGRVLAAREDNQIGITALPPNEKQERDLSWLDGSWVRDISNDGSTILFDEEVSGGGSTGGVYLRNTDASPAVRLGDGNAVSLSPDGKLALARKRSTDPPRLVIYPTGVGEAKEIVAGQITFQETGKWFPDSKRLLLVGNAPNEKPHCYIYDIETNQAQPITREGTTSRQLTPDGKYIFIRGKGTERSLVSIDGKETISLKGFEENDFPIRFSADGKFMYVTHLNETPVKIFSVSIPDGQREQIHEITQTDRAGLVYTTPAFLSSDGKAYAYTYTRVFSNLFLIDGVR